MKRRLLDPYLFGPLGLDTTHPWWLTGGLPSIPGLYNQPAGEGGAAGGGNGGADGEPNTPATGAGGAGDSGSGNGGDDKPETVSKADFDRVKTHLAEADRKREEAEKRLKEIDDKDKSELEKVTERTQELEKALQERDSVLAELRLENAFLTVNGVRWHDSKAALLLAQREGYLDGVADDKGKVDQGKLKAALDKLAKEKAYLVNKDDGAGAPPPSGTPAGSGSRTTKNGPDDAALRERYRTLRR